MTKLADRAYALEELEALLLNLKGEVPDADTKAQNVHDRFLRGNAALRI